MHHVTRIRYPLVITNEKPRSRAQTKTPQRRVERAHKGRGKGMNNLNLALQGSRVAIRHRADCR
jgi:hypothetical protein